MNNPLNGYWLIIWNQTNRCSTRIHSWTSFEVHTQKAITSAKINCNVHVYADGTVLHGQCFPHIDITLVVYPRTLKPPLMHIWRLISLQEWHHLNSLMNNLMIQYHCIICLSHCSGGIFSFTLQFIEVCEDSLTHHSISTGMRSGLWLGRRNNFFLSFFSRSIRFAEVLGIIGMVV